jgi:hypothetical protein
MDETQYLVGLRQRGEVIRRVVRKFTGRIYVNRDQRLVDTEVLAGR